MACQQTPVSRKSDRKTTAKTDHSCSIMSTMNNQRKQGLLCDVTLVVQGKNFPAHRGVLAAASNFFHLMFTTRMKESLSSEVELGGTEPEIVEILVDFIYTGRISVNSSNVVALAHAANQYLIDSVKTTCEEFLRGQIDAANCLGISALAEDIYCPELKDKAENYLQKHFRKVSELDEFLQLDVTRLTRLLRQDKLIVSTEEQIYDAALRWLKVDPSRRQHVVEVLSCVRFPLISRTFLSKTVQAEPLIQSNVQCLNMVISGMSYHLLNPRDRADLGEIGRRRFKKPSPRIALFHDSQPHSSRYFNPKDSSWTCIRCSMETRQDAAAVYWDNVVYVLGGSRLSDLEGHTDCYNVHRDSWCSKPGPPSPRSSLAACVAQGTIYASGGVSEDGWTLGCFESYNAETGVWGIEPDMPTPRCCHGSVEVNGLVYVCGGMVDTNITGILSSCEVYNPNTQEWRELSSMRQARKNHGLVAVRNRIYAVGGQGPQGRLSSVECYDIEADEWRPAMSMPWLGLTVKCAAVGDVVYVLAGKCRGTEQLKNVMEYHTRTDRWVVNFRVQAFPFTNCIICAVDA